MPQDLVHTSAEDADSVMQLCPQASCTTCFLAKLVCSAMGLFWYHIQVAHWRASHKPGADPFECNHCRWANKGVFGGLALQHEPLSHR